MELSNFFKHASSEQLESIIEHNTAVLKILESVTNETQFELCGNPVGYALSLLNVFSFNELSKREKQKQQS